MGVIKRDENMGGFVEMVGVWEGRGNDGVRKKGGYEVIVRGVEGKGEILSE